MYKISPDRAKHLLARLINEEIEEHLRLTKYLIGSEVIRKVIGQEFAIDLGIKLSKIWREYEKAV